MSDLSRKDIGITGLIIILTQAFTAFKSSDSITEEVRKLKKASVDAKAERGVLSKKIDKIYARLNEIQMRFSQNEPEYEREHVHEPITLDKKMKSEVAHRD